MYEIYTEFCESKFQNIEDSKLRWKIFVFSKQKF